MRGSERCATGQPPLLIQWHIQPTGKGEMADRMEMPNGHLTDLAIGMVEHCRELLPHHRTGYHLYRKKEG